MTMMSSWVEEWTNSLEMNVFEVSLWSTRKNTLLLPNTNTTSHKAVIFLELFHQIKSLGGRFLKYVNTAWIEVTESVALDKCKRAL